MRDLRQQGPNCEKKARLDLLKSSPTRVAGAQRNIPQISNSPLLDSLKAQEADISRREADLIARYNDRHPLVVNIMAEKRDVQRSMTAERQRILRKHRERV